MVVGIACERQLYFVPDKICARNLLKDSGGRLKHDGVGKRNDSSARLIVAGPTQSHQVNAYEPKLDDFARDARDLHAIANPQTVLTDKEKVTNDTHDNVLQRDRDPSSQQARESHRRPELRCERKNNDDGNRDPNRNPPQQEELVSPAAVMHITERGPAPHFSQAEN